MSGERLRLLFLNLGHTYDHLFMLLYATAVITMEAHFDLTYGELLALATPGFIAFGAGALPAGWLGDRWSRTGMITLFFIGIGAASVLTGLARTPLEIATGLFLIGVFASIYHPVGIAMVAEGAPERLGWRIGVNGVFGNMGVAGAALVAAFLAETISWRAAFIVPGVVAVATGLGFRVLANRMHAAGAPRKPAKKGVGMIPGWQRALAVIAITTLFGGIIFNATTVSLPKVFDERLGGIALTTIGVGAMASIVYAVAGFIQIVVGKLVDRYPVRPIFIGITGAQVLTLIVAAYATDWAMFLIALCIMLLVFGQIPIADTLVARFTPDEYRSRVYSVKYLLTLGVSSMAVPAIAILHGVGDGFATLFFALAACALLVWLATLALPGRRAVAVAPAE